ncbi:uncharacterized protein [Alexandromys fortis]|nr:uncharacterized protein LOC126495570 isoform X2 [Microtus fortis]XP_049989127.1 uncharacterized protein LOC126495570 isoform X3 [Microtus fortis]XP_049989128.1 uncharacterized protein LOC126495570 isoform X4 [Microtus fortis]
MPTADGSRLSRQHCFPLVLVTCSRRPENQVLHLWHAWPQGRENGPAPQAMPTADGSRLSRQHCFPLVLVTCSRRPENQVLHLWHAWPQGRENGPAPQAMPTADGSRLSRQHCFPLVLVTCSRRPENQVLHLWHAWPQGRENGSAPQAMPMADGSRLSHLQCCRLVLVTCSRSPENQGSIMKFSCQRMIDGKDLLQKSLQGMTKTRKYMNEDYSDLHFLPYIIQKPYSEDELETLWTVPSLPPADSSRQSSLYLLMSLSCVAADTICR